MPRTSKCRRVCAEPKARVFTPEPKSGGRVSLSVEELEMGTWVTEQKTTS